MTLSHAQRLSPLFLSPPLLQPRLSCGSRRLSSSASHGGCRRHAVAASSATSHRAAPRAARCRRVAAAGLSHVALVLSRVQQLSPPSSCRRLCHAADAGVWQREGGRGRCQSLGTADRAAALAPLYLQRQGTPHSMLCDVVVGRLQGPRHSARHAIRIRAIPCRVDTRLGWVLWAAVFLAWGCSAALTGMGRTKQNLCSVSTPLHNVSPVSGLRMGSSALVRPQCRSGLTTPPAVLECGPSRASGPRCAVRRCPCTPPTSLRRRHTGREGGRCVSPCVIVSWSSTMLSHRGSEGHSQSRSRGDLRSNISSAQDGEGSENFCCAVFSLPRWSAEQGRAPPPPRLSSSSACVLFAGSGNERVEHGVRPRRVDRGGVVCPTEAKTAPFGSASWQRHHSSQHGASGYAAAFECADVRGTVDWAAHHGAATTRELQRTNCCAAQRKQKQGSATQVTDLRDGRLRDLHPRSGATRRSQHDAQDTRRRGIASVQALERTNGCVLVTQTAAQRSYRLSWADGCATCTLGLALVLRCAPTVRACGCSGEAAAPLRQAIESTWADASDALVEIRSFELAIISSTAVENLPASGSKFILFGCHG